GVMRNDARRWLELGDYQFQPSELMTILLIIALARYLSDRPSKAPRRIRHLVVPFIMFLVPVVLIVNQPDLSTGIICSLVALTMLALTELSLKSILALLSTGVAM